jgi:hypothetical protein
MNAMLDTSLSRSASAFDQGLTLESLRARAPAVLAESAHERTSRKYTFIPTSQVLNGLMQVGLVPVDARQTNTRSSSPVHARHVVRLRRRFETVRLHDSVPEIVLLNSHDGTSAYQLRMGLFRVVCTNGLIVSRGAFPGYCVSHRGNVVDEVVTSALKMAENFEGLAAEVARMEQRPMFKDEQVRFAERALQIRYPIISDSGMEPSRLLNCRRPEDVGDDLWSTLNRVQENLLRGGLTRRSVRGRLTRTRAITSIKEDVRLNGRLWDVAREVLAA